MATTIIAQFGCHRDRSTLNVLSVTDGIYKHEKCWFNPFCTSDRIYEIHTSKKFERAQESFLINASVALDSSQSYNSDVTDEQILEIRDAINDTKEFAEYLEETR